MPPPIVRGMKSRSAVRRATSSIVLRSSSVAEMSRKTISSAPRLVALREFDGVADVLEILELDALTTPAPLTSRQGIIRLESIATSSGPSTSSRAARRRARRVAQREPERLEAGLVDVVVVLALHHDVVQRDARLHREGAEEVLQHLVGHRDVAVGPVDEVDGDEHERVVHRDVADPTAGRAGPSARRGRRGRA